MRVTDIHGQSATVDGITLSPDEVVAVALGRHLVVSFPVEVPETLDDAVQVA